MRVPTELYRPSLALLTDLYELTMAHGFWRAGMTGHDAVFHHVFRANPFGGGFTIACGLAYLVDHLEHLAFSQDDLTYLASLGGSDSRPLFDGAFLAHLAELRFACDVDAVPEGTVVFPHEPLVRVRGPLLQAQLVETAVLNLLNFQTLVATKAARICLATEGQPVLEFGARRAQGIDGALSASRAAYIGGCAGTSNVLAGRLFDIPVRGTHAHSWVMAFADEETAFDRYAEAQPGNCVFLVDTYDSLEGVRHAIAAARRLRERGHELAGIRLDSGDLAYLSVKARAMLDGAGFAKVAIFASNDLDEHIIQSLKREQGAAIGVWGVGTKLATAFDDPALGGVYKLGALRAPGGRWEPKVKLSEQTAKVSTPGVLQVRRFGRGGAALADAIYDESSPEPAEWTIVDPLDATRRRRLDKHERGTDLLVPVFRAGQRVYEPPPPAAARARAHAELGRFHAGIKRFVNPHRFPVGLERGLFDEKTRLVLEARSQTL
jgi:nicotinate phosphoribosyltransferase